MTPLQRSFFIFKVVGAVFLLSLFTLIYLKSVQDSETRNPQPFSENTRLPLSDRKPAPYLEWSPPSGQVERLSDLKGRVVYVNFWAYWCQPCLEELPWLESLQNSVGQDQLRVLLINVDSDPDLIAKAKQFAQAKAPNSYSVFDGGPEIQINLGVDRLPYHLVVDKSGQLAGEYFGNLMDNTGQVKALVLQLVAEPL